MCGSSPASASIGQLSSRGPEAERSGGSGVRYVSGLQSEQCVREWEEGEGEEEEEGRFRNKTRTLHCDLVSWCCLDLKVLLLQTAIILQLLMLPLKQQLQLSQARFKLHLTWHT